MPGFWNINDREVIQLAGYVRSLGQIAPVSLPGDAARGRALFENKGACLGCHIVHGTGSSLGPELTGVGARRSGTYLHDVLTKPAAALPEGFLMVRVTPKDGKSVRGMRVNEDTFTIQLRDAANHFHSFRKSDLTSLERESSQTFMPDYQSKLTAAELDDLVAYLASLRGGL